MVAKEKCRKQKIEESIFQTHYSRSLASYFKSLCNTYEGKYMIRLALMARLELPLHNYICNSASFDGREKQGRKRSLRRQKQNIE